MKRWKSIPQNIETAKQLAREKLHTIELIENKAKNLTPFLPLMIVIVTHWYLFATNTKQSVASEKEVE